MLNSITRTSLEDKTFRRMHRHLFIGGAIEFTSILTPFSSMYRCWKFQSGSAKWVCKVGLQRLSSQSTTFSDSE